MLARPFVLIAFVACVTNAAPLPSSTTPQDLQDLEVITLDAQGNPAKTLYYSYDQLLTLPMVTVKTARDPNTNTPATYAGVYISDLFDAFGAATSFDVIGANRLDRFKQYYDRDYIAKHRPILLLKFDDKPPANWPNKEDGSMLGPYCVVHEGFSPPETIYGYVEQARNIYGVVSLELTRFSQSLGLFTPKKNGSDPEVVKGQKIAVGSCISCHNLGNAGGRSAGRSWAELVAFAVNNKDHFRKKIIDPRSMNPGSAMPANPKFDDNALNALEVYFKAMTPIE
jgi:hypothetical protein